MSAHTPEKETLRTIMITICQPCLDGVKSECHTPGCALFLHRVDLPIHPELYTVIENELVCLAAPKMYETLLFIMRGLLKGSIRSKPIMTGMDNPNADCFDMISLNEIIAKVLARAEGRAE